MSTNIEMLYFSAKWCPPCKVTSPIVEQLIAEGYNIRKIDCDLDKATADQFSIAAIPTFVVLKDGNPVVRFSGARNKAALVEAMNV